VVVTWDYYAQPKTLIVHALNNSGKDIVGYTLSIRHKLPDGTLDKGGWSETSSDMLAVLVDVELANEPVEESERKSDHGILFWTAQAQRSQDLAAWQRLNTKNAVGISVMDVMGAMADVRETLLTTPFSPEAAAQIHDGEFRRRAESNRAFQ
jgi:hypothetical protein